MTTGKEIPAFNPNGVGLRNGNFIGLPFSSSEAAVVLIPVPWDLTTSYCPGTAGGPANILGESVQLDLYDPFVPEGWKAGICMLPEKEQWKQVNDSNRMKAERYIRFLEEGGRPDSDPEMKKLRDELNRLCRELHEEVYGLCKSQLNLGKIPGVVGGEHSVSLGVLKALSERYGSFGILQIDAHMDLRESYEGLEFSHASIMYNALHLENISGLVQVGVRDYCEEEAERGMASQRIQAFTDQWLKERQLSGSSFLSSVTEIIAELPERVYVSFDIDGLDPSLCPGTGTPVPGGLSYSEAVFLLRELVKSGRQIIGFDLTETAGTGSWDGNVGARLLYQLSILAIRSWNLA
ncbi:MAG: agmatinase family protein [Bacteroidota bacterium]